MCCLQTFYNLSYSTGRWGREGDGRGVGLGSGVGLGRGVEMERGVGLGRVAGMRRGVGRGWGKGESGKEEFGRRRRSLGGVGGEEREEKGVGREGVGGRVCVVLSLTILHIKQFLFSN